MAEPSTNLWATTIANASGGVKDLAAAIAFAEGWNADPQNVPTRANNPGDLKVPGWTGPVTGAEDIPIFETIEEGWARLYLQLQRIVNGASHVYRRNMSFEEFAQRWTDTAQGSWLTTVLEELNHRGYPVDAQSSLGNVI